MHGHYHLVRQEAVASLWVAAVVFGSCSLVSAQTLSITRPDAAYTPTQKLDPAKVIDPANFDTLSQRQYVVVEGYINYIAVFPTAEGDGDFHFEMQRTPTLRKPGSDPNGLVCEIDPVLQLGGCDAFRQIKRHDPATFRKVRVYGFLRFGTEITHSGVRLYNVGGQVIKGHWEIHPVEEVVSIDNKPHFQIGPSAKYVSPTKSKSLRYKLNDTNFEGRSATNYGALRGTIKGIKTSPNQSGDLDVALQVNLTMYTATIPQYYVTSFNPGSQTVSFVQLPNFASIHYSLKPSDAKQQTFYGLRNWSFSQGKATPALQPVEMIK